MNEISLVKSLQQLIKSRLLTCEGEIVAHLIENGPSRPKNILFSSSYSHVAVFNKLKDMTNNGILKRTNSYPSNKSIYELSDDLMEHVLNIELGCGGIKKLKHSAIYKTLNSHSDFLSDGYLIKNDEVNFK